MGCNHNLLLRCVLESLLTFFEKYYISLVIKFSCEIYHLFRNNYTIDLLLKFIGEFPDEFKSLSAGALTHLCKDREVLSIFKAFGGTEKLLK